MLFIVISSLFFIACVDKKDNKQNEQLKKTDEILIKKPVIYLYPEKEQKVSVRINYKGNLTFTYPKYEDGWNVVAYPNGTLINLSDSREYSYLFWEGKATEKKWDLNKGFVVKGEDTVDFLKQKLSELGLIPKEYNDFIVYWAPRMEVNEYNLVHFAGEQYEELAKLEIKPKPDSILRVFMVYKSLEKKIEIEEQDISQFRREGFAVIEWGGTEIQ